MISEYIPILQKCIAEKLWLKQGPVWYSPFDWAVRFHATWLGFNFVPLLKSPHQLLEEAEAVIQGKTEPEASLLRLRYHAFKRRVIEYYESDKDQRLLNAMERNVWPGDE